MKYKGLFVFLLFLPLLLHAEDGSFGIGLTKEVWEKSHKLTGSDIVGSVYDNKYVVMFSKDRVSYIEILFKKPFPSIKEAENTAKSLIPRDSVFVKKYSPEGIPEKQVLLYKSKWLSSELIYQYNIYSDTSSKGVGRLVIAIGNNP